MKLFFITAHYRTAENYGGQRSRFMFEAALSAGFDAYIFRPSIDSLTGRPVESTDDPSICSVWTTRFAFRNRRFFTLRVLSQLIYSVGLLFKLFRVCGKPLVVLNNNPMITYFVIGTALRRVGYPYLLDQRDVPFDVLREKSKWLHEVFNAWHTYIYNGRQGSVTVSDGMFHALHRGSEHSTDEVIELGMDSDLSFENKQVSFIPQKARLVYVGSLNNYFGLESICDQLEACQFRGSITYYGSSECSRLQDYNFFTHAGAISKGKLAAVLESYDLGLFPLLSYKTTWYLLGNKVFDYLLSGLPVLYYCEKREGQLEVENALATKNVALNFSAIDWSSDKQHLLELDHRVLGQYQRTFINKRLREFFSTQKKPTN